VTGLALDAAEAGDSVVEFTETLSRRDWLPFYQPGWRALSPFRPV